MVVVGGLVGGGALGYDVVSGFSQNNLFGLGLAAGISGRELRTPPPLSTDADVRNLFAEDCPGEIDVAPASNRRRPWLFAALLLGLVIAVALIGSAMLYFRVDWTEAVKLFDARF